MYARVVNRHAEMVVRTALGASRARIVGQLFAEALVLSTCAAGLGLVGARFFLRQVDATFREAGGAQVPFWWRFDLSSETGVYVVGLAVLAAIIVGAVPALKATSSSPRDNLQRLGSGGTAPQLGRLWTTM